MTNPESNRFLNNVLDESSYRNVESDVEALAARDQVWPVYVENNALNLANITLRDLTSGGMHLSVNVKPRFTSYLVDLYYGRGEEPSYGSRLSQVDVISVRSPVKNANGDALFLSASVSQSGDLQILLGLLDGISDPRTMDRSVLYERLSRLIPDPEKYPLDQIAFQILRKFPSLLTSGYIESRTLEELLPFVTEAELTEYRHNSSYISHKLKHNKALYMWGNGQNLLALVYGQYLSYEYTKKVLRPGISGTMLGSVDDVQDDSCLFHMVPTADATVLTIYANGMVHPEAFMPNAIYDRETVTLMRQLMITRRMTSSEAKAELRRTGHYDRSYDHKNNQHGRVAVMNGGAYQLRVFRENPPLAVESLGGLMAILIVGDGVTAPFSRYDEQFDRRGFLDLIEHMILSDDFDGVNQRLRQVARDTYMLPEKLDSGGEMSRQNFLQRENMYDDISYARLMMGKRNLGFLAGNLWWGGI